MWSFKKKKIIKKTYPYDISKYNLGQLWDIIQTKQGEESLLEASKEPIIRGKYFGYDTTQAEAEQQMIKYCVDDTISLYVRRIFKKRLICDTIKRIRLNYEL